MFQEAELKIFDNAKVVGNRTIDPRDRALVKVSRKYFDKVALNKLVNICGLFLLTV